MRKRIWNCISQITARQIHTVRKRIVMDLPHGDWTSNTNRCSATILSTPHQFQMDKSKSSEGSDNTLLS